MARNYDKEINELKELGNAHTRALTDLSKELANMWSMLAKLRVVEDKEESRIIV